MPPPKKTSSASLLPADQRFDALFARGRFGMQPGIARMTALLERLDNPQRHFASIHIAGTNGKGSVAAMLSAILHAAGYPVGRYTSPHLIRFNERFVLNETPIPDERLIPAVAAVEQAATHVESQSGEAPTFFECATAIAFWLIHEAGLPLAVIETGLGGRLDATNVLLPALSVITRIAMDHTQWLGNTLAAIASEKAGIIKPGRPVVRGAMPPEAAVVIETAAARLKAPCIAAEQAAGVVPLTADWQGQSLRLNTTTRELGVVHTPLNGQFQLENIATVATACDVLQDHVGLAVPDEAIRQGLAQVHWPGRFQCIRQDPPILVDGAHNPDAARALRASLRRLAPRHTVGLVIGMCDDKDVDAFLRLLADLPERAWAVTVPSPRALPADQLCARLRRLRLPTEAATLETALLEADAWAKTTSTPLILVCGSLFLAGQVLATFSAPADATLKAPHPPCPADPNESLHAPP